MLATGGYGNVFYLSTNAMNCNATAAWRAHKKGALFANPCYTQIHPTCIPASDEFQSKLTLMSESLRNDGRIWVPKNPDDTRPPDQIPEADRDYFLERKYPAFGNLVPRDVRQPQRQDAWSTRATASARSRTASTSTSATPSTASARASSAERYGNLFDMYERITDENPYKVPMRIYPAIHYTMGGLWVDYNLMTTVPGPLRAWARPTSPTTAPTASAPRRSCRAWPTATSCCPTRSATTSPGLLGQPPVPTDDPEFTGGRGGAHRPRSTAGCRSAAPSRSTTTTASSARSCGTTAAWPATGPGSRRPSREIPALREEFEKDVRVLGSAETRQPVAREGAAGRRLLRAGRADVPRRPHREESCGGHFRVEHQTDDGEAQRDDEHFAYVGAWEWQGKGTPQELHKEPLEFEYVHLTQRSYK